MSCFGFRIYIINLKLLDLLNLLDILSTTIIRFKSSAMYYINSILFEFD